MLLHSEIRAFYIKIPSISTINHSIIDTLWGASKHLPIISIDFSDNSELIVHSAIDFSAGAWDEALRLARQYCIALNAKSGYIFIRHVCVNHDTLSLFTEIETYKLTRRGLYLSRLPEIPSLIEDIIRLSGNNKRLQQIELMGNLFKFIEGSENNET